MSYDVYTFCTDTGALVTDPPGQWILKGPSDQDPWTAAYWNSITKKILTDLQPLHGMYDSAGPGFQANKISPWGYPTQSDPVADDGILLSDWGANAVILKATTSRGVQIDVASGHAWTWAADGYLTIVTTKGVKGLRAAQDASSELRYGYDSAAYPTFRYDFSPRNGGWSVTNPLEAAYFAQAPLASSKAALTGAGLSPPYTAVARMPLQIPHDTTRGAGKVAFQLKGLYVGGLALSGASSTTTIAVKVRNQSTGSVTTLLSVTSTSTSPADLSDTGTVTLATPTGEHFVEWSVADASVMDGAEVGYVYLNIEKRAVE